MIRELFIYAVGVILVKFGLLDQRVFAEEMLEVNVECEN